MFVLRYSLYFVCCKRLLNAFAYLKIYLDIQQFSFYQLIYFNVIELTD